MLTIEAALGQSAFASRTLRAPESAGYSGADASKGLQVAEKLEPFVISVNRKPVSVIGPITTGLEIKVSAKEQGVTIELDFQLAKVTSDGVQRIVGDDDKVDVTEYKTFFATATDDNA